MFFHCRGVGRDLLISCFRIHAQDNIITARSHVGLKRAMKEREAGQKKGGKASQNREWDNKRQSEEHPRMMHRTAYRKDPVDRAQK